MDKFEYCSLRLLLAGNVAGDNERNVGVILKKLEPFLSKRTLVNYRNILKRYLAYCYESKYKYSDPAIATQYIRLGIQENKWSVKYAKMITTVLSKYALSGNSLKFFEIKKKSYRTVSNKFDTQSFNSKQVMAMLECLALKPENDDLFLLILILDGTGLRFIETTQLKLKDVKSLLRGNAVSIVSAKTKTIDNIKLLPKYRVGGECKLLSGKSVGDVALEKIRNGITMRSSANKPTAVESEDVLFSKKFESYRKRFKPLKDAFVESGTGTHNNKRQSTRGSCFHAFRRRFATNLYDDLQGSSSPTVQTSVVGRALRHSGTSNVRHYIRPNEDEIENTLQQIF